MAWQCLFCYVHVALLAVASVTVEFLLLQSHVNVSQALPVEALWACFLVVEFLWTKCWVNLLGQQCQRSDVVFHRDEGPRGH